MKYDDNKKEIFSLYRDCGLFTQLFVYLSLRAIPYYFKLEKWVPKNGRILDMGCGHGILTNIIKQCSDQREVIGIDIDDRKIKTADKTIGFRKSIRFINISLPNLEEDNLDCIVISTVLYNIPYKEQLQILRLCYNMLKRGGLLLLLEFGKRPKWKYYYGYIREFLMTKLYTRSKGLFFRTQEDYQKILEDIGFSVSVSSLGMKILPTLVFRCLKEIRYETCYSSQSPK